MQNFSGKISKPMNNKESLNKKISGYPDFHDVMMQSFRDHPEDLDSYLQVAIEDYENERNLDAFLLALRTIAEAKDSMTGLAKKTNLSRQALYKALSSKGNPRLDTIWSILNALGYRLCIKPV